MLDGPCPSRCCCKSRKSLVVPYSVLSPSFVKNTYHNKLGKAKIPEGFTWTVSSGLMVLRDTVMLRKKAFWGRLKMSSTS